MRWLALLSLAITVEIATEGCQQEAEAQSAPPSVLSHRGGGPSAHSTRARPNLPHTRSAGDLEEVAEFAGPMPTGVTVSHDGRVFVSFPRWGDPVPFTVAEIHDGVARAYPDAEINRLDLDHAGTSLVSVQSVVVDPANRLWLLDTGSTNFGSVHPGGAKLVGVDLAHDRVFRTVVFPPDVALASSYLNDVRFDLRRGREGFAFITDSSTSGTNGIVVVDLASGRSWRRLGGHPSTLPDRTMQPFVEGRPLRTREPGRAPHPPTIGADGIALSADGSRLYYCPLVSRHLFSVSVDALIDPQRSDADVASTVLDHGEKGASDGLESDAEGRLYFTEYEQNAIVRRAANGALETLVSDPRALWPDTLSIASNGYLYFTANQLERMARFNDGHDLRQHPYMLFRVRVDANRLTLR